MHVNKTFVLSVDKHVQLIEDILSYESG